jgi:hypothetical protein
MQAVRITLDKADAEALLPLIWEQSDDNVGFAAGMYWRGLYSAIRAAIDESDGAEQARVT